MITRVSSCPPAGADRLLLVFSDLELGAGGPMDDFPQSEFIGDILAQYNTKEYQNQAIEVLFNGDTFDFLKISVEGRYPHHITASIAQAKLRSLAAAHQGFFRCLGQFLSRGQERRVHFLAGNHDLELFFPSIKEAISGLIDKGAQVLFHDDFWQSGDVHVEHGHQRVGMFRVDPQAPFVSHKGEKLLRLPWANVALLDGLIPLKPLLYPYDRIKPKSLLFELMPALRSFLQQVYWRYWTRDFWKWGDPMKKINLQMLKDILYSIFFVGPDTILSPKPCRDALMRSSSHRVFLVGHEHEAGWWSRCGQKLLYTGCFRNEFILSVDEEGRPSQQLQPKVYAEVWMQGDRTLRSQLIEVEGPEPPAEYQPDSIFHEPPDFRAPD